MSAIDELKRLEKDWSEFTSYMNSCRHEKRDPMLVDVGRHVSKNNEPLIPPKLTSSIHVEAQIVIFDLLARAYKTEKERLESAAVTEARDVLNRLGNGLGQ